MENEISDILNQYNIKATNIKELSGGMMNHAYLIDDKIIVYLPTAQSNSMVDRKLEQIAQKRGSDVNIAPKNIFCNIETGVKANQFIKGKSLNLLDNFDTDKVATLLKKYHSQKRCNVSYNPFKRLEEYRNNKNNLTSTIDSKVEEIYSFLKNKENYLTNREQVLSHNDAQKSNIISGEDGNYYLIDFEFAADNDPIYDIATFGNNDIDDGVKVLKQYYKSELNEELTNIYYLWRTFISLQWHYVALVKHYSGEGKEHNYDFLQVAEMFKQSMIKSYERIIK